MDVAFRRYEPAAARLVSGGRIFALPLGLLQRVDDDVSVGARLSAASAAAEHVERLEADYVRIRRHALRRLVCPAVCASVLGGVVRFPGQARSLRGLLQKFNHGDGSASTVLPGIAQAIS